MSSMSLDAIDGANTAGRSVSRLIPTVPGASVIARSSSAPFLGVRPQLHRNAIDSRRRRQLGLGTVGCAATKCGRQIASHARTAAEFEALLVLAIGLGAGLRALGLRGAIFFFNAGCRRADQALQIGGAGLDGVEFATLFVAERVEQRELAHAAAFLGLAVAKIAEPFLCVSH